MSTDQRNRRLLMFNLMTDNRNPVLGFTTAWIRELARHYQAIDVITMYEGEYDLPEHVTVFSAGREQGLSKPVRVLNFYRYLVRLLATQQYDACFAHMMPLFAGLAGPLLTLRGIRTVLWYTHRQTSSQLKLGTKMSWRVVTAVSTSFPYDTPKLRVIGHGIDTHFYTPTQQGYQPDTLGDQPIVIQVARLAAIKHQDTTIQAVAGVNVHLILVGDVQAGSPQTYKEELLEMIASMSMDEAVTFVGNQPSAQVRDWYQRAAIAVNMSPVGLFDKAALESMACGVPTIVCNDEFAPLMGDYADLLIVRSPRDVDGLRERIQRLLAMPVTQRAMIGQTLREAVQQQYSLSHLTSNLVGVLQTGEISE